MCRSCEIANVDCIYAEKSKRVSVLLSSVQNMKKTISDLRQRLSVYEPVGPTKIPLDDSEVIFSHIDKEIQNALPEKGQLEGLATMLPLPHRRGTSYSRKRPNVNEDIPLEAGSSDFIITKLARIQDIDVVDDLLHRNEKNVPGLKPGVSKAEIVLPVSFCKDMIDNVHFFLASINLPFEMEEILSKLNLFSEGDYITFADELDQDWMPLLLVLIGLGQHYSGNGFQKISNCAPNMEGSDNSQSRRLYFWIGLSQILPCRREINEQHIIILILATYYFRAVNEDDFAILYSAMAIEMSVRLGIHEESKEASFAITYLERRRRIWWAAYTTNRFLCAKLGHPTSLDVNQISTEYPNMTIFNANGEVKRILFPDAEDMRFYIDLAKIAEDIVNVIYQKRKDSKYRKMASSKAGSSGLVKSVISIISRLIKWNELLPTNLRLSLDEKEKEDIKERRLKFSVHLSYCYQIHLASIPVLYQLFYEKTVSAQSGNAFELSNASTNTLSALTICVNAAQLTTEIMWICFRQMMIAAFGVVDPEYTFSAAVTLVLAKNLGLDDRSDIDKSLNSCLRILEELSKMGNHIAQEKLSKINLFIKEIGVRDTLNDSNSISKGQRWSRMHSSAEPDAGLISENIEDINLQHVKSEVKIRNEEFSLPSLDFMEPTLSQTLSFPEIEANFQGNEDMHFWENAYTNVHLWSSHYDIWDI